MAAHVNARTATPTRNTGLGKPRFEADPLLHILSVELPKGGGKKSSRPLFPACSREVPCSSTSMPTLSLENTKK